MQQNAQILSSTLGCIENLNKVEGHNHTELALLILKKNRSQPLAVITLEHFFELLEKED